MARSAPVDGFRLTYDREGSGPPVVLLHGWPGDRADFREVKSLLGDAFEVIIPTCADPETPTSIRSPRHARTPRRLTREASWVSSMNWVCKPR
jgi:pimeloyl-ACP methyl ester carboxylesterase